MAGRKKASNKKKRIWGFLAVLLIVTVATGIALRPLDTAAYGVFSGVETVVMDKVSSGDSYHILEIVPDGAVGEIGYLCEGQEPDYFQDRLSEYIEQNQGTFTNTRENRIQYMNDLIQTLTAAGLCGTDQPLEATKYEEQYFLGENAAADTQILKFPQGSCETVSLDGSYVVNDEQNGLYAPSVVSFTYNSAGDYYVEFGATKPIADELPYNQPYEYKAGGYYVPVQNPKEDTTYYYITKFSYYGVDSASSLYIADLDASMPYTYVGEDGDYDFVPGGSQTYQVQIGQVYYRGGITNQNWFANKILCKEDTDKLKIEVQTVTESELSNADLSNVDFIYICGDTTGTGKKYGDTASGQKAAVSAQTTKLKKMVEGKVPCMIDSSILSDCVKDAAKSDICQLVLDLADTITMDTTTAETTYAKDNLYFIKTTENNKRNPFFSDLTVQMSEEAVAAGFENVKGLIWQENSLRTGDDLLDTGISKATVIQYIINYKNERTFSQKESLRVLDIEPAMGDLYLAANDNTEDSRVLTKKMVSEWTGIAKDNITITRMTTAEFIGTIEDLNTEYDLIYIGLGYSADYMNRSNGATVYNDTLMNGLVYTHTGDAVLRRPILAGLLDTDYVNNDSANYFYGYNLGNANDAYGYRIVKNAAGKLVVSLKTITNFMYDDPSLSDSNNSKASKKINVSVGNVGVYRFSGNDITNTKYTDLQQYLGAKYPVIFAEGFLTAAEDVNTAILDNSSILYQFLNENKTEDNVFYVKDGKIAESTLFSYYLNMPKLSLTLYNPTDGSVPTDSALSKGTELTASNSYGNKVMQIDTGSAAKTGSYTLRMKITVDSSVDSTTKTRYIPKLYFDMNADGRFVSNDTYSEIMSDCLIVDSKGKQPAKNSDGYYTLTSGETYTLEKDIPSTYRGILTWKLEICQASNEYIRTAKTGYTVISKGSNTDIQTVQVLQVTGVKNNNWVLKDDSDIKSYIAKFAQSEGIQFELTTMTATNFQNNIKSFDNLKQYDMLIFGFEDSYSDISNKNGALDATEDFINSGRSVLFTHDCTSFVNVETEQKYCYDLGTDYGAKWLSFQNGVGSWSDGLEAHWGYYINNKLRNILGMDRYGITYSEKTASNSLALNRYTLLKQGQILNLQQKYDNSGNLTETIGTIDTSAAAGGVTTQNLSSASLGNDKDIAYAAGTGRSQSYGETQGYTYGAINFNYRTNSEVANYTFNKYMNLNAISVPSSSDGAGTGQIGNMRATQVNDGQITHYPYEIGDTITIADTHYQYYQLDLDQDLDGDGNSDIVVWYCLSSTTNSSKNVYTASPNDVRNNYYIYSIGNVMYSGVGHSKVTNAEEKRLFFNTIVASYKIGIKNPTVTILSGSDRTSEEKEYEYLPFDTTIGEKELDSEFSFYYLVSEPNLVTSKKVITADYQFSDGQAISTTDQGNGSVYITTEAVSGGKLSQSGTSKITGLQSGNVYKATIHNMSSTKLKQMLGSGNFGVQVNISSSFNYYGVSYGTGNSDNPAPEASTTLKFIKTTLFDLH